MSNEHEKRALLVEKAKGYLRTPYHPEGRMRGVGVDCLTLLAGVYEEAGLVPRLEIEHYPPDFMHHRSEERYLEGLLGYTREVERPEQGDIALWKFGRCFSHAAIVVEWPTVIHARVRVGVMYEDAEAAEWLKFVGDNTRDRGKPRPVKFFSYWGEDGFPARQQEGQDADHGGGRR